MPANTMDSDFCLEARKEEELIINACSNGDKKAIEDFLNSEQDVNQIFSSNWTLLHYAASYCQVEIIELLLKHGADSNKTSNGFTALMALSNTKSGTQNDHIKCLDTLLKAQANANITSKFRETALMYACNEQDIDFISILLDNVDCINASDNEGNTALFYAVLNNRYEVAKLLLEKGADFEIVNARGLTPYDLAVSKEYNKLYALLGSDTKEHEENVECSQLSPWEDLFPVLDKDEQILHPDIAVMLNGMNLDYYSKLFKEINTKSFLSLTEKELEDIGIDLSVHRRKFSLRLNMFHGHKLNSSVFPVGNDKRFDTFDILKNVGNINRQITTVTSYFDLVLKEVELWEKSQNYSLELPQAEKEKILKDIQHIEKDAKLMKIFLNKLLMKAKVAEKKYPWRIPILIKKKTRKTSFLFWIATLSVPAIGIWLWTLRYFNSTYILNYIRSKSI